MSMRASHRRTTAVVSARAFEWDRAAIATLRHASLPWNETVSVTTLQAMRDSGVRDRLSLLAQFAAHQAFLRFAGIADGDVAPDEWGVVQKRGGDARLVRLAAHRCDPSEAPPALTLAERFADAVDAKIEVLQQSWARADAIYADVFARLERDVAADLQWMRNAACGAVISPGPDALRSMWGEDGVHHYSDAECVGAVRRFAELDPTCCVVMLRGVSPLQPYSAFGSLEIRRDLAPAVAAERVIAATSSARHLFVVTDIGAFDTSSRELMTILSEARHGSWLIPAERATLPPTRAFLVAPRLAARAAVTGSTEEFVTSPAFADYLRDGGIPAGRGTLPAMTEPTRSFIGVLALLGDRVSRVSANSVLGEFLFKGDIEDLAIEGVTSVDGDDLTFVSETAHEEAAALIPQSSRAAICRLAAPHASGVRAALLWIDAGDTPRAADVLRSTTWATPQETADALRRVPVSALTPDLLCLYANALIECGRYRDARDLCPADDLVLARAERRMGDYATALARRSRCEPSFDVLLLRAEVLRLLDREEEAREVLASCVPLDERQRVRLDYERALTGAGVSLPAGIYLESRLATYRALEAERFDEAALFAEQSRERASTTIERIDASLDRIFAHFSAGEWDAARAAAVEALSEVEETQGDRAAGGILFTLAYLAADDAQWSHAAQRIARLRHFYTSTRDEVRLAELHLLVAHLEFSRGRFSDARRSAQVICDRRGHHGQIREAAALILDEIDWMDGAQTPLRSTGRSGNVELTRRHERLKNRSPEPHDPATIPGRLYAFRRAVAARDDGTAKRIATELDLVFESAPPPTDVELRVLRTAALLEFPFAPHDFEIPWCYATRNRLGHWNVIGSLTPAENVLESPDRPADWIECGELQLLCLAGSAQWSAAGRDAAAAMFRLRSENQRLRRLLDQEEAAISARPAAIDGIVGQCAAIREVESLVARVARRDVAVCILGESGTGKELVARAIHRQSPRRQKAFTAVNCAALPENLIESELFGHARGAFTGADRDRPGLIETTDGGTLFLDEIGELPMPAQAKLLRFLQEGEFRRVGETASRSADVRIVSATNRKLDAAVEEGRFRDDLYYRVRGVEVVLPPLRDRGGDVLLLARHFLEAEREKHRIGPRAFSQEVEAIITAYSWPGNVRELQNTIRAAHAMAGEGKEIDLAHLPERLRNVAPVRAHAGSYQHEVIRFKRGLIERSLQQANGNQNRAASLLKMSRQALAYQIRELGILVRS